MSSNFFSSTSRYLPPPIRTHYSTHPRNDLERAANFLNQDWCRPSTPATSPRYRLSTKAVFPSRSDGSHSSDDELESDSDYRLTCEHFTTNSPPPLSHIDVFKSDSVYDQIGLVSQDYSHSRKSSPIHTTCGPRQATSRHSTDSHGAAHSQERVWPAALHPSQSSVPNSPQLPPINALSPRRHPSRNSSTLSPPPATPSPPPVVVKSEPSAPSIPYVNNNTNTPDVDGYIEKVGSSKSMCVWRLEGAGEHMVCGFESSGSLVKRHIRTVHLKIRPVTCSVCHQGFSTKFHLKTHANIHTGLKPYSCPDCSKTFSNPSSKHHHRVRYHGYVQSWRHYGDKDKSAR